MTTQTLRKEAAKAVIDRAVRKVLKAAGRRSPLRIALERLIRQVRGRADFFRAARVGAADEVADGLLSLASFHKDWLRPVEDWSPPEANPLPQFSALAHHLLALYPVPPVLASAWFRGQDFVGRRWQRAFLHIARGKTGRTAPLPITPTRRMAHEFLNAPPHLTIEQALRGAEVVGLGGTPELASAIADTRLGHDFTCDSFWRTVFLFFINTPRLDLAHVGPIVDYIEERKYTRRTVEVADGITVALEPDAADFSIKGRTVASLLRDIAAWRKHAAVPIGRESLRWPRCPIGEYRADDGSAREIRQLLSALELAVEGRAMHNCVGEYASSCLKGATTIWSLGVEDGGGRKPSVTIEVKPASRTIVQALRPCNEPPDDADKALIRAWADREGLAGAEDW